MEASANGGRQPRYRRILLKLSGEALLGKKAFGIDQDVLAQYAVETRHLRDPSEMTDEELQELLDQARGTEELEED